MTAKTRVTPHKIPADFFPNAKMKTATEKTIKVHGMDVQFSDELFAKIVEMFVLYWDTRGLRRADWNRVYSAFLRSNIFGSRVWQAYKVVRNSPRPPPGFTPPAGGKQVIIA